jgi:hypothetical protein
MLIRAFGDSAPALWLCAAALCSIAGALALHRQGAAGRPRRAPYAEKSA